MRTYIVTTLNGIVLSCLSPWEFSPFVRGILADGYLIADKAFVPLHAIAAISVGGQAPAAQVVHLVKP